MRSTRFCLCLCLAAAACSRTPSELGAAPQPPASETAPIPSAAEAPSPHLVRSAPTGAPRALALKWDDPPRWQRRVPSTPMRAAEYRVPRAGADAEDAECSVITFGSGQGGSVDDNIDRWVRQFQPATSAVDRSQRTVDGMAATRVEVAGTYTPMAMPAMPASTTTPRPGQRLVGYIVEAPSGFWYFKMTGPDATVRAAARELDTLIDSLRPT